MERVMKNMNMVMVAAACAALAGGVGYAQTVPGAAGAGDSCFVTANFPGAPPTKSNMCFEGFGVTRRLVIPTQAYGYGWYNQVVARAASNGNGTLTTCRGIGTNANGSLASLSQNVSTDFTTNITTMFLGSVFVPTSGTLHVECAVAQGGGRVLSVEI
jgi:hypothetical protein